MKFASWLSLLLLLSACSTPAIAPSDTAKADDSQLACEQLQSEYAAVQRARDDAEKEKGFTGANIVAALFFLPALFDTYSKANQAIATADARHARLTDLMNRRGCPSPEPGKVASK